MYIYVAFCRRNCGCCFRALLFILSIYKLLEIMSNAVAVCLVSALHARSRAHTHTLTHIQTRTRSHDNWNCLAHYLKPCSARCCRSVLREPSNQIYYWWLIRHWYRHCRLGQPRGTCFNASGICNREYVQLFIAHTLPFRLGVGRHVRCEIYIFTIPSCSLAIPVMLSETKHDEVPRAKFYISMACIHKWNLIFIGWSIMVYIYWCSSERSALVSLQ